MSFFENLWNKIKTIFTKDVWPFMKPYAANLAKVGGEAFMAICLSAVQTMATTQLTNEEKREEAVKKIKADALARGIQAGEGMIRSSLEIALMQLKTGTPNRLS